MVCVVSQLHWIRVWQDDKHCWCLSSQGKNTADPEALSPLDSLQVAAQEQVDQHATALSSCSCSPALQRAQ